MRAPDRRSMLRLVRYVVIAAMAWSLVVVIAMLVWAGEPLLSRLHAVSAPLVIAAITVFVLYHGLRFVRWDLMLRAEGHAVPWWRGLSIFMAGVALTPTPAKAGVAARSVLLIREGVPVHVSMAAYFAERLLDLVGLIILASALLAAMLPRYSAIIGWTVAVGGVAAVIIAPRALLALRARVHPTGRAAAALDWTIRCFADASRMLSSWRLPLFVILGAASNAAAGVLLWLSVPEPALTLQQGVGIVAVSHLSGSISLLPGGLGGFDLAMIAQLEALRVSPVDALTALSIVRLSTFWSGIAAGLPLLWLGIRRVDGGES